MLAKEAENELTLNEKINLKFSSLAFEIHALLQSRHYLNQIVI